MIKLLFQILLLFLSTPLFAQTSEPISLIPEVKRRAVVIGISNYEEKAISPLKYANRDAEKFATFLLSEIGGSINPNDLKLLTNEEATSGKVRSALKWLAHTAQSDEQVIIYFSGHGDIEKETTEGFLLMHNAPAFDYWDGGALAVSELNKRIKNIADKCQKVIMVADACRAGTLAGNDIEGNKLTTIALKERYDRELRILSCKPGQQSIESAELGEGRGVFSYFLELGLLGGADEDDNYQVDLEELELYLKSTIAKVTDKEQYPIVEGELDQPLSHFATSNIDSLQEVLTKNSKVLVSAYRAKGVYYPNPNLHLIARMKEAMEVLYLDSKLTIIASVEDEVQQYIQRYLYQDSQEIDMNYLRNANYYTKFLVDKIEDNDIAFNQYLAKFFFFKGLKFKTDLIDNDTTSFDLANSSFKKSIEYYPSSPICLNELGDTYNYQYQYSEASNFLNKAKSYCPLWFKPYLNQAINYYIIGKTTKSSLEKKYAFDLNPSIISLYSNLEFIKDKYTSNIIPLKYNSGYILTGGHDGNAKLWEIETGIEIFNFRTSDWVLSVAFSPDGRYILTGGSNGIARLWSLSNGKEVIEFKDNFFINAMFSPNGKLILIVDIYGRVTLWDLSKRQIIRSFQGISNQTPATTFSPDGKYILIGGYGNILELWQTSTGKKIYNLEGHSSWIKSVAFSPNGKYALSGDSNGILKLWSLKTGKELRTYETNGEELATVTFFPDGKSIMIASTYGEVKKIDFKSGKEIFAFEENGVINSLSISSNGELLLFSTSSRAILRNATTGEIIQTFGEKGKSIDCVAFSSQYDQIIKENQQRLIEKNKPNFIIDTTMFKKGKFYDSRNNQIYNTVKIGDKVWFAENLNYKVSNSWCYDDIQENCEKFGRLYSWESAKKACPKGWHLPGMEEWKKFEEKYGILAYKYLTSKNQIGFNAKLGGYRNSDELYKSMNYNGAYWSSSENSYSYAWYYEFSGNNTSFKKFGSKDGGKSCRCIKN